jgi:hypothetical protein
MVPSVQRWVLPHCIAWVESRGAAAAPLARSILAEMAQSNDDGRASQASTALSGLRKRRQ